MRYFCLVLLWVTVLSGTIALMLRSGTRYSAHDAKEHATEYGGGIREAHGPVTAFLWACYAGAAIFTVVYSVIRWSEITEMFKMMGM